MKRVDSRLKNSRPLQSDFCGAGAQGICTVRRKIDERRRFVPYMASSLCFALPSLAVLPRLSCSDSILACPVGDTQGIKVCFCDQKSSQLKVPIFKEFMQRVDVNSLSSSARPKPAAVVSVLANGAATISFDKTTAIGYESTALDAASSSEPGIEFIGVHHVGSLCENLERSLEFYVGVLGLSLNPERPSSLPYRGAWLWAGSQMIHLMELPNPDPVNGRPGYEGRDRHVCIAVKDLDRLEAVLRKKEIPFNRSSSGRPVIFCRDPDGNAFEFSEA